jgi:hypothetical protein
MKPNEILICDDQDIYIKNFIENHKDAFKITSEADIHKVFTRINEKKPDVLLIDLYHPKDNLPDFEVRKSIANEELKNLDKQILITKKAVDNVWVPLGIDILEQVRAKFDAEDLPVIIYTQRGFILVEDEQIRRVERFKGFWMQKKVNQASTEKVILNRILEKNRKISPFRNRNFYFLLLFIFLFSFFFFKTLNLTAYMDLIIAVFNTILSLSIGKLIEKKQYF